MVRKTTWQNIVQPLSSLISTQKKAIYNYVLLLFVILLLSGCGDVAVVQELEQGEAHAIVAALLEKGIPARIEKERGARAKYTVWVPEAGYGESVKILNEQQLIHEQTPMVSELLKGSSLLPPSRDVEQMRLDYALASQLQDLIAEVPGVSTAKVMVQLRSIASGQLPSVSVILKSEIGGRVVSSEIVDLVAKSVGGIDRERISVQVVSTPSLKTETLPSVGTAIPVAKQMTPFLGIWRVPSDQYVGIAVTVVALLLFMALAGGCVGFYAGQRKLVESATSRLSEEERAPEELEEE
jgi:type III secretory pathway lipoprotein EscJ